MTPVALAEPIAVCGYCDGAEQIRAEAEARGFDVTSRICGECRKRLEQYPEAERPRIGGGVRR